MPAQGRQKTTLVDHKRMESFLPQVTAPTLAEIYFPCVAGAGLVKKGGEALPPHTIAAFGTGTK
jgi:hypothetical protein